MQLNEHFAVLRQPPINDYSSCPASSQPSQLLPNNGMLQSRACSGRDSSLDSTQLIGWQRFWNEFYRREAKGPNRFQNGTFP